jgi:hypothetical protein
MQNRIEYNRRSFLHAAVRGSVFLVYPNRPQGLKYVLKSFAGSRSMLIA